MPTKALVLVALIAFMAMFLAVSMLMAFAGFCVFTAFACAFSWLAITFAFFASAFAWFAFTFLLRYLGVHLAVGLFFLSKTGGEKCKCYY